MDSDINMIHSSSILGARLDGSRVRECLEQAINRAIADGYTTFITSIFTDYQQAAARYISEIRKTDCNIQLFLVVPYAVDEARLKAHNYEIYQTANKIINAAEDTEPEPYVKTIAWMIEHSRRILYVKASNRSKKDMIKSLDLRNKELYIITAKPNISNRTKGTDPVYSIYPYNLLCEILRSEPPEDFFIPSDFEARLNRLLSQKDTRTHDIMLLRYKQGYNLREISERYEMSRERIRQIIEHEISTLRSRENMIYLLSKEQLNMAGIDCITNLQQDVITLNREVLEAR